jgi:aconitate hydratase
VKNPPYFEGMSKEATPVSDIKGARVLALLGDSVTTDHISPAGAIAKDSPAAAYLEANGVKHADFNSYATALPPAPKAVGPAISRAASRCRSLMHP